MSKVRMILTFSLIPIFCLSFLQLSGQERFSPSYFLSSPEAFPDTKVIPVNFLNRWKVKNLYVGVGNYSIVQTVSLKNFPNLEQLHLCETNIYDDEVFSMGLSHFHYDENRTFNARYIPLSYPRGIFELTKLKVLDYSNICESDGSTFYLSVSIPDDISKLSSLKILSLPGRYTMTYCPESIGDLNELTYLNMVHSPYYFFPLSIYRLPKLKVLCLQNLSDISIPEIDLFHFLRPDVQLNYQPYYYYRQTDSIAGQAFLNDNSFAKIHYPKDTVIFLHYKNGNPEIKGTIVNGLLEGEWKTWNENGAPWQTRYYKNGKPTGKWESRANENKFHFNIEYSKIPGFFQYSFIDSCSNSYGIQSGQLWYEKGYPAKTWTFHFVEKTPYDESIWADSISGRNKFQHYQLTQTFENGVLNGKVSLLSKHDSDSYYFKNGILENFTEYNRENKKQTAKSNFDKNKSGHCLLYNENGDVLEESRYDKGVKIYFKDRNSAVLVRNRNSSHWKQSK